MFLHLCRDSRECLMCSDEAQVSNILSKKVSRANVRDQPLMTILNRKKVNVTIKICSATGGPTNEKSCMGFSPIFRHVQDYSGGNLPKFLPG